MRARRLRPGLGAGPTSSSTIGLHLVLVAGLLLGACSSGTSAVSPTTQAPKPAGTLPSSIARQVCSREAQTDIASALGEKADVSTPTWADHLYACTYSYPDSTPSGSIALSVKELSNWDQTYAYFDSLGKSEAGTQALENLGQGAFQTADGSVIVRKDWKVLVVDINGLPAQFGIPATSSAAVAVTVADVILGCWAGD